MQREGEIEQEREIQVTKREGGFQGSSVIALQWKNCFYTLPDFPQDLLVQSLFPYEKGLPKCGSAFSERKNGAFPREKAITKHALIVAHKVGKKGHNDFKNWPSPSPTRKMVSKSPPVPQLAESHCFWVLNTLISYLLVKAMGVSQGHFSLILEHQNYYFLKISCTTHLIE